MRLIVKSEYFSDIGEMTDCFYAFFLMDGALFSVHRRHRLFSFPSWPRSREENISQIILTRYHRGHPGETDYEEVLCDGNDPRVVSLGNTAYVVSQGALHSNVNHILTILPSKKMMEVSLAPGATEGKNWQPFIRDNELHIVDSISPFRVNRLSVETGLMTREKEIPNDLLLNAGHDQYSILRGGSNALSDGDAIYGWGHATVAEYRHVPYIWKQTDNSITTCFTNIHGFFAERGYNIVDPTSFFEWDENHFALGVTCSQRDWFHPQWFLNALLIFDKKDFMNFAPLDFSGQETGVERRSILFHTQEMSTLIDSEKVHGGLRSNGRGGCLVCGPSREIEVGKPRIAELCYSSPAKTSQAVGEFDILLNVDGRDHQVATTTIYGTANRSVRVPLRFQFDAPRNKALIQTRVFARRRRDITAYFFELFHG